MKADSNITKEEQLLRTARKSRLFYIHKHLMPTLLRQWSEARRIKREQISLSDYVNRLVNSALRREEVLNKLLPNLNFVGIVENEMVIHDATNDGMYRVKRIDGGLECLNDNSNNCCHVIFAMTTAEITQLFTNFNSDGITLSDHTTASGRILKDERMVNE